MLTHFPDTTAGAMRAIATRRPNVFMAFLGLAHEVMHMDAGLSKLDRELVGAYVSQQFGCNFCHFGHLDVAEVLGGTGARAAVDAPSEKLVALFRLADKVAANTITDADIDAVIAAGFSEQAVEDVIFVTSLFGFANRMVTGFAIDYVEARDRETSQRLAKGYVWKQG
jgi:uncharacterized peroxidase-related enzyme